MRAAGTHPERPRTSWRALANRLSFWVFGFLAALAVIFVIAGRIESRSGALLDAEGVDTMAEVVQRHAEVRRRSSGTSETDYAVTLRFTPDGGITHETRHAVQRSDYERLTIGDRMPLRYAASDPSVSELDPGRRSFNGRMLNWLALGLVAATLVAGAVLAGSLNRLRRALHQGSRQIVTVLRHSPVGARRYKRFAAEWQDASGRRHATTPLKTRQLPPVGSEIAVWIDPKTGRGWWEGEI